jgi:hypothetical protein
LTAANQAFGSSTSHRLDLRQLKIDAALVSVSTTEQHGFELRKLHQNWIGKGSRIA